MQLYDLLQLRSNIFSPTAPVYCVYSLSLELQHFLIAGFFFFFFKEFTGGASPIFAVGLTCSSSSIFIHTIDLSPSDIGVHEFSLSCKHDLSIEIRCVGVLEKRACGHHLHQFWFSAICIFKIPVQGGTQQQHSFSQDNEACFFSLFLEVFYLVSRSECSLRNPSSSCSAVKRLILGFVKLYLPLTL